MLKQIDWKLRATIAAFAVCALTLGGYAIVAGASTNGTGDPQDRCVCALVADNPAGGATELPAPCVCANVAVTSTSDAVESPSYTGTGTPVTEPAPSQLPPDSAPPVQTDNPLAESTLGR